VPREASRARWIGSCVIGTTHRSVHQPVQSKLRKGPSVITLDACMAFRPLVDELGALRSRFVAQVGEGHGTLNAKAVLFNEVYFVNPPLSV